MSYSTHAHVVSGLSPSLEETFVQESDAMHTNLQAALGQADMAALEANRLTSLLTPAAFATQAEQAQMRELYRDAVHKARCRPDDAISYLGTISGATPSLQQTIKSFMRTNTTPIIGQPLFTTG
jgi:hypothetical protein